MKIYYFNSLSESDDFKSNLIFITLLKKRKKNYQLNTYYCYCYCYKLEENLLCNSDIIKRHTK